MHVTRPDLGLFLSWSRDGEERKVWQRACTSPPPPPPPRPLPAHFPAICRNLLWVLIGSLPLFSICICCDLVSYTLKSTQWWGFQNDNKAFSRVVNLKPKHSYVFCIKRERRVQASSVWLWFVNHQIKIKQNQSKRKVAFDNSVKRTSLIILNKEF